MRSPEGSALRGDHRVRRGSFWEMSTVVTGVRRRWEGWAECDGGRMVLRHPAAENDDEDSIWHSGFIPQHSAGDCGRAKRGCARGGTATEHGSRGGGASDSGCGCRGPTLRRRTADQFKLHAPGFAKAGPAKHVSSPGDQRDGAGSRSGTICSMRRQCSGQPQCSRQRQCDA